MLCPTCGKELNKLSVTTNQGGRFDVDHCGFCGGTWFDPYEINRIPFHEVVNLAGVTVLPNNKKINQNSVQLCPNDSRELEIFKGEAVPSGVRLLWCRKCLGIWATQKDLLEFKKHQEDTVSAYDEGNKFFPKLSVVMIPAITFILLLATTFTTITGLQKSKEDRILAENQITNLQTQIISENSLILTFDTSVPALSSVFYGASTLELTESIISSEPAVSHTIILQDLKPGENYLYKIQLTDEYGVSYTSDLKSFSTQ